MRRRLLIASSDYETGAWSLEAATKEKEHLVFLLQGVMSKVRLSNLRP